MLRTYLFLTIGYWVVCSENALIGCYNNINHSQNKEIPQHDTVNQCIKNCGQNYYRYANFHESLCICSNYLGEQASNVTCKEYCLENSCQPPLVLSDTYSTGNLVPGPPRNLQITNITANSCHISWREPESYTDIVGYVIKAAVLQTFSSYSPVSPDWIYNNTFDAEIITLLPASKYNISVTTKSTAGFGASVYQIIYTKLGEPDNIPPQPSVLKRDGSQLFIKLSDVINNNGPITAYRVVVESSEGIQAFDEHNVLPYEEANKNGLNYYITAELSPEDVTKEFIVGDGRKYGKYYNAPLNTAVNYNVLVGIVSEYKGEVKVKYSEASDTQDGVVILNVDEHTGDSPAVIIGLSVAIGLLSFMFIAGIFGFIILKSRVANRRSRLSENQELTLQGPMIEVENNGYIHEEEHIPAIGHYRNLKQKVRSIPANQLKIEPTNLLGIGKFGRVNTGTLHENDTLTTITAYSIYDKKMNQETKKAMLQQLDLLIKTGKHENIVSLIGTSETPQVVVVVMEYTSMNLKDLLLGSRDTLPGRFSNMSETQALDIAIGICTGMAHLHSCNIVHKQLCARSIMIANGFTPKIGSYGLAQYFSHNKIPDYTRWTALEAFKGQPHNPKSDIWSFGCLLWEICALGGTPYGNLPNNNEIPEKISRGLRLPQLRYVSDEFYQNMLDCWQLDCDERPHFAHLINIINNLKQLNSLIPNLSFSLYSNFQYEQFFPDMELSVRPVF